MDEYQWNARIAVGVDGSPESRTAALWADEEALERRCGLTLAHTVLPPVGSSPFSSGLPKDLNPEAEVRQGALAELDEIASTLTAADVQTRIEVGSPSGIMIGASETAAIVVVGSRGQGGFKRLLLGSVSTQVATHSQCPVIVIRSLPDPSADTVVLGMDGTAGSSAAIGFAFNMASLSSWRLVVGNRSHGQVMSAVLGSVSHGVLHHAQAPVAVVSRHQSATVAP